MSAPPAETDTEAPTAQKQNPQHRVTEGSSEAERQKSSTSAFAPVVGLPPSHPLLSRTSVYLTPVIGLEPTSNLRSPSNPLSTRPLAKTPRPTPPICNKSSVASAASATPTNNVQDSFR